MQLTKKQVIALKRKRGERNLSTGELAQEIGVSYYTMHRIINGGTSRNLTSTTARKVNNWIIDQYTTIN